MTNFGSSSDLPRVKGIVSKKSPGARDYVSATLIVVLVLLLLGTAIIGEFWDQRWIPAYAMIHAPMLLLGWWVGVSRVRVPWKLAGYSLGITFVFLLFSRDYVTHLSREIPCGTERCSVVIGGFSRSVHF